MEKLSSLFSPRRLIFKIVFIFCVVSVCANIIMSLFFYKSSSTIINNNNAAFTNSYAKSVSECVDSYILEIDKEAKIILGNAQIQNIVFRMNQPDYTKLQMVNDLQTIKKTIWSFTSFRDGTNITLVDKDGSLINPATIYYATYNLNMLEDAYVRDNLAALAKGDFLLVPPYRTKFTFYGDKPAFMLVRSLNDLETGVTLAYLMIIFDTDAIYAKLMENALKGAKVDLIDSNGYIVMSLERSRIGKKAAYTPDNERTASFRSSITGFTSHISIPDSYLNNPLRSVLSFLFPLSLIVILGSFIIAAFMFSNVLKPIERLIAAMKRVDQGNLDINLKEKPNSIEVETLFNNFNHMFVEIRNLTQTVIDEKLLYKNAQMAALQYQINPHFLYNTLQTMEAIGQVNRVQEIQVMAKSLGNLFRYNIKGSNVVSLSEELEQVETYLKIEKIRFRNRLDYQVVSTDEARQCRILKFILQPIVENCIVHGMKGYKNGGHIALETYVEEGVLIIKVYNSGAPIGAERLASLNGSLNEISRNGTPLKISDAIGLINVHSRLINSFGNKYGVSIEYSDERGTCVRLTIPADMGVMENV